MTLPRHRYRPQDQQKLVVGGSSRIVRTLDCQVGIPSRTREGHDPQSLMVGSRHFFRARYCTKHGMPVKWTTKQTICARVIIASRDNAHLASRRVWNDKQDYNYPQVSS